MLERRNKFISLLKEKEPKLNIAFKDESTLMKAIQYVLFFNPAFSTGFITTIGKTIYFPSASYFNGLTDNAIMNILSHEYIHIRDSSKNPFFYFLYLLPQIAAPLFLLLGIWSWIAASIMFAICLAPWPAFFRKKYEFHGYTADLFISNYFLLERGISKEERAKILKSKADVFKTYFSDFSYYKMWPFNMDKEFSDIIDKILSGDISREDEIFNELLSSLDKSKN